jgi:hypothetical protein
VAAGANHGDSGSPVFWQSSSGEYWLLGILWGGSSPTGGNSTQYYFSQWSGIKQELSPYAVMRVAPAPPPPPGCVAPPNGPPCAV